MTKLNVLIVGSGHYVTGMTVLSGVKQTDKDKGVLLPALLALKKDDVIDNIGIVSRDGKKLKVAIESYGLDRKVCDSLRLYPSEDAVDETAYINALDNMPKPLAVIIAVPDYLHENVILACIERGSPFLVLKPAVTTLASYYKILKALSKNPILGMVDYHKVYDDANLLLKNDIKNSEYGKLQHISSVMTQRREMLDLYSRWIEADINLNINHYLGSHYIHLTGFITGAEPIDVRATAQYGVAEKKFNKKIADLIETQIRWKLGNDCIFTSYHIAGWSDPSETESMTRQELGLICEHGHVYSDQKYRGFRKILSDKGSLTPNPYYFDLTPDIFGDSNLHGKYGFLSVKYFLKMILDIDNSKKTLSDVDKFLPSITESGRVTAILEAADKSLACSSAVVSINKNDSGQYELN